MLETLPERCGKHLTEVKLTHAVPANLDASHPPEQARMYRHILVPTDGSKLSAEAVKTAVQLAKALGAKVTGAYVVVPYVSPFYGDAAAYTPALSGRQHSQLVKQEARKALAVVEGAAQAADVRCSTMSVTNEHPWRGIVRAAQARKCDVIVMASHGRRGLTGLLLGSETNKVLTHSKIPVLVCR
jgi:nucleotide-binding universal stress UspA family protein